MPWSTWNQTQYQKWDKSKGKQEKEKPKPEKAEKGKMTFIGYDGKKVDVQEERHGAPSSSASSTSVEAVLKEENRLLKEAMRQIRDGKDVQLAEDPEIGPLLEKDPRESLKERQKMLNQERKTINRVEKIRASILEEEKRFAGWKRFMDAGMKQEAQRHASTMERACSRVEGGREEWPADRCGNGTTWNSDQHRTHGGEASAQRVHDLCSHDGEETDATYRAAERCMWGNASNRDLGLATGVATATDPAKRKRYEPSCNGGHRGFGGGQRAYQIGKKRAAIRERGPVCRMVAARHWIGRGGATVGTAQRCLPNGNFEPDRQGASSVQVQRTIWTSRPDDPEGREQPSRSQSEGNGTSQCPAFPEDGEREEKGCQYALSDPSGIKEIDGGSVAECREAQRPGLLRAELGYNHGFCANFQGCIHEHEWFLFGFESCGTNLALDGLGSIGLVGGDFKAAGLGMAWVPSSLGTLGSLNEVFYGLSSFVDYFQRKNVANACDISSCCLGFGNLGAFLPDWVVHGVAVQIFFLIWSTIITRALLLVSEGFRNNRKCHVKLPTLDNIRMIVVMIVLSALCNGAILESRPWGMAGVTGNDVAVGFLWAHVFIILSLAVVSCRRLICEKNLKLRPAIFVGKRRLAVNTSSAASMRMRGLLILGNILCSQAIPVLNNIDPAPDWHAPSLSESVPAYQSPESEECSRWSSLPCGTPSCYSGFDDRKEGQGLGESADNFDGTEVGDKSPSVSDFWVAQSIEPPFCRFDLPNSRHDQDFAKPDFVPTAVATKPESKYGDPSISDYSSLMQRSEFRFLPDPLLGYVWGVTQASTSVVVTWLHTWDRRNSWSHVRKDAVISGRELVRDQIVRIWRDYQVRPTVTIMPIRPQPDFELARRPSFLLSPVSLEAWIGFLAVVRTPHQYTVGTFLMYSRGMPMVQEVFQVTMPNNQCVWTTNCWIVMDGRVYDFWSFVPIFEGAYIRIFEVDPAPSSEATTCSAGADSSVLSDSWPGDDSSQFSNASDWTQMQGDNTATPEDDNEEASSIMQIWRKNAQPLSSFLVETELQYPSSDADVLRDAYLRVFEQQGDLIITIKSYLHCWSGTPVRTSVQIRASEGQHLTKQVLEAWRCLGNRHLKAFFVYPTPRRGLRRTSMPIVLLRDAMDDHLLTIYVEMHAMPFTTASVQFAPGSTLRDIVQLVLGRTIAPNEHFVARDMAKPRWVIAPLHEVRTQNGAYLVVYVKSPESACHSHDGMYGDQVNMMQTTITAKNSVDFRGLALDSPLFAFWSDFAAFARDSGGPTVSIVTHGLRAIHVEARKIDLTRRIWHNDEELIRNLRDLWRDYLGRQDDLSVVTVVPAVEEAALRSELQLWTSGLVLGVCLCSSNGLMR